MNNQVAQAPTPAERGLPELPEPFDTVRVNDFSLQEAPVFSAGQMRAYALAALSARPLPSDWVAVPREPTWIVNDLGELGVMVDGVPYFLYKGDNIIYADPKHDDGSPMLYRMVGKREFGETCWPRKWIEAGRRKDRYTEKLVYTPGLSDGKPEDGDWRPLSAVNRKATPSAPAEAVQLRPLSERLYRGPAHPDAHREQYLEGKTAPEPLAQGDVVAYIESYEVGGVQRSGLVWADHPADTPGHTFKPLYASPQPAAEGSDNCEDCQIHRKAHHALDNIVIGADAFEVLHEGGVEPAWMNTIEAVKKLANPPQPSASVAWSVLRIGRHGAAYDAPNTKRAYTYDYQPDNVDASRLGEALKIAANASYGDSIDRGLSLLKALQGIGFGVFQVGEASALTTAAGGGGEVGNG